VSEKLPIAVLVSGSGTNLQAILDACQRPDFPARVGLVVSNVKDAYALERAKAAKVETAVIPHQAHADRAAYDAALVERIRQSGASLVCLAGFMRLLGSTFLDAFPHRVMNIHPALLPAFKGMHAVRQALDHGVSISGCTVHLVDGGVDTGPIIAQAAVPVLAGDDEAKLAARIQVQEHRLYPLVVRWFAEGRVRVEGRRVKVDGVREDAQAALFCPGAP
jgi:phosphoribosylglycinamide formyltransferase 1